jgi:hypothetical protein
MNKTNIKRVRAFALALLTTLTLSACAQAPSDGSIEKQEVDYSTYAIINVNGVDCRISADTLSSGTGWMLYRLEDGTKILVSAATGKLLKYEKDSTVMEEAMEKIEDQLDEPILTLD